MINSITAGTLGVFFASSNAVFISSCRRTHYDRYIEELYKVFEQNAENDKLVMANKTIVYLGHLG